MWFSEEIIRSGNREECESDDVPRVLSQRLAKEMTCTHGLPSFPTPDGVGEDRERNMKEREG